MHRIYNAVHPGLSSTSSVQNMRHYRDRSFHSTRQNNETTLWNHIQQVCRREEDIDRRLSAASQLQDFVAKSAHKMIISRNLDQALNSLLDVFFERSAEDLQNKVMNVLANIGLTLAYDAFPLFQWLLRQFQTIANDNVRSYLLRGLTELLQKDQNFKYFGKLIGILMDELQSLLESVDVPDQLPVCVEPLILVSQSYPQVLAKHFRDVVDILVGWHIDHTQPMSLIMFCADALIKLQPHWQTDMEFSLTLLNQFLEDMEAYAEGLHKVQPEESSDVPEDSPLPKIAALMRAFSTVVRSIGTLFHVPEAVITEAFVLEMLHRVIVCAQLVGDMSFVITCAANECMQLLIAAVHWRGEEMLSESLLTYVVHGVERSHSEPRILLVLRLLSVMVQEIGSALPAWFIVGLLGPSSRLLPLKYKRNPKVTSELLSLYQACLSVKNVSLLQTAYRNVVGELQYALNQLLKFRNASTQPIVILQDNPFVDVKFQPADDMHTNGDQQKGLLIDYEEKCMLKTALFDITALSEVSDAKNSIIGMYALSPSIFDLLHTELQVVHEELGSMYPQIQYAVLCTLYSHCQRHKHFVSSFLGGSSPQSPISMTTSPAAVTPVTHGHYPLVLLLISKLLIGKLSSTATRRLLLHWAEGLLQTVKEYKDSYVTLMAEPHFSHLLYSLSVLGTHQTAELVSVVTKCFSIVFSMLSVEGVSASQREMAYESGLRLCLALVYNLDRKVQESSFELLQKIPMDMILKFSSSTDRSETELQFSAIGAVAHTSNKPALGRHRNFDTSHLNQPIKSLDSRRLWLAKRGHMMRTPQEITFFSHHFRNIMESLLRGSLSADCAARLKRTFWSCQRTDIRPMVCQDAAVASNFGYMYWWALWECATFTVSNKLRTTLGRPQDTFQKIEGTLRDFENQLNSGQKPVVFKKSAGALRLNELGRNFQSTIQSVMQRPHLLLQFLYSLEKLMFNAYSGCISIAAPSKAVRTFFSTNRSTCEQWLNRLRLAAMRVALNCRLPSTALFHGQKILHDMKVNSNTQGPGFELAITMTTEALVELGCPQAIEGMYKWCREVTKSCNPTMSSVAIKQKWAWIKAAKNQANHCYEDAAKDYVTIFSNLVKKDSSSEKGLSSQQSSTGMFIMQQASDCYLALSDWEKAAKWIKQSKDIADETTAQHLPNLDYVEALRSFADDDHERCAEKCKSALKDLSSLTSSHKQINGKPTLVLDDLRTWRWPHLQVASDIHLLLACMGKNEDEANNLDKVKFVCESALQLNVHYWPISIDGDFLSMHKISNCINLDDLPSISPEIFKNAKWDSASNRLLLFLDSQFAKENSIIGEDTLFEFRLASCTMNRKKNNPDRCVRLFGDMLQILDNGTFIENGTMEFRDLRQVAAACEVGRSKMEGTGSSNLLDMQYELSKGLITFGNGTLGLGLMADTLLAHLDTGQDRDSCARVMLSLSKYLHAEWKSVTPLLQPLVSNSDSEASSDLAEKFHRLINHKRIKPSFQMLAGNEQLLNEAGTEILLGTLMNSATIHAPDLAKAWFNAAGWCYKWGRKIVDAASNSGSVELTNDETHQVQAVLAPYNASPEMLQEISDILCQAHSSLSNVQEDDITGQQQDRKSDGSEIIYNQLLSCCDGWLQQLPQPILHNLHAIWHNVCTRLFAQYHAAADAYFRFLRLNVNSRTAMTHEDTNVISTLRLLRLLAKHAMELQTSLKDGLEKTPTSPWNGIIPQLFSRLNHPEPYVRQSISNLLCRVARDAAHLVVYPVVVATTHADRKSRAMLRNASLEAIQQEDETGNDMDRPTVNGIAEDANGDLISAMDAEANKSMKGLERTSSAYCLEGSVNACYHNVLQSLREQNEDMVNDTQLLVLELCRITLLWDELWLGTLNQHHQDIMKRLHQLHDEAKRVNLNHSLSKEEKHAILREQQQAIMRPVMYALLRIQRITGTTPETPHEQWFAENMQPLIDQAMKRLIQPPNPQNPNSCWSGFKQIHFQLSTRASKRSSQLLNLGEISPKLMELSSTSMPIPGVSVCNREVTIQGCSSVVTILPTKTKPKKLQFIGSNALRYTYLFKGLEDLHLDERIMQFLFITNQLLKRQHEDAGYAARHYSVTPLGARSGLIQWVDGATPLFTLYKRWQQREALQQTMASGVMPKPVLRPSEIYYNKLNPALKKAGVDVDKVSRKDWPSEVLGDVLKALIEDTPGDLLHRELWCSSTSPSKFWDMQQKYSCSTAVMSMIGYVIGLGDRHLDNVLIDLETGEVVHIDYNVCFEKGAQLRVPERVPFRLTQNIKTALGLTNVEGVFRHACEQVISTLRKGRETLLTLLEAFVYDPLVDWTGTVEGGYAGAVYGGGGQQADSAMANKLSKHDMEREITRSLFSSRIAEMKRGWLENRDEMLKVLPDVIDQLQDYKKHFNAHVDTTSRIQSLLELKAQVKSAVGDSRHPFNTLKNRWTQHTLQKSKKDSALQAIREKISICDANVKKYKAFLATTQTPELAGLLADVSCPLQLGEATYESAVAFLNSAGQAVMVSQAQATEKELITVSEQCRLALRSCLEALTTYAAIAAQFPPTAVITNHQEAIWSSRLSRLKTSFSEVNGESIQSILEGTNSRDAAISQVRSAAVKDATLQQEVADLNNFLLKLLERRNGQQVKERAILEKNVNLTRDRILGFVQENGYVGMHSVLSVLTLALTALEQRGITMETTAAQAGHRLVDMTSQDGDWFLEELCSLFGNVVQLLRVCEQVFSVSNPQMPMNPEAVQAVLSSDACFRSLMDLFNNFRNIILPEAVKLLQCEESSVIDLVNKFNVILQGAKLDDFAKQLMSRLRGNSGQANGTCSEALAAVNNIQNQYGKLLHDVRQAHQDDQRLSAGQMLLQGFDGLFHTVHSNFIELVHLQNCVTERVQSQWSVSVDVLEQPESLQKMKNVTSAKEPILQGLLFVKQLQAMYDFFVLCQSNARSFIVERQPATPGAGSHYTSSKSLYSEERLMKPVKHFIAHFVQELLIGIPSQVLGATLCSYLGLLGVDIDAEFEANRQSSAATQVIVIEELCKSEVDKKYTQANLSKQRMLIYHFNRAWKDLDRAQRLDANIAAVRASLQRGQLQLTRFQWLHEDILLEGSSPSFVLPRRLDVLTDLTKRMHTLRHLEGLLLQKQETAVTQNKSILQRLKWAAGANPSLQSVLQEVESNIQKRNVVMQKEATLSSKVSELCGTAVEFEESRIKAVSTSGNRSYASASEKVYLQILETCEQISASMAHTPVKISQSEVALVNVVLSKSTGSNSSLSDDWLLKAGDTLQSCTAQLRQARQQEELRMQSVKSKLTNTANTVKQLLTIHSRLLSDVKNLLKVLAKDDKVDDKTKAKQNGESVAEGSWQDDETGSVTSVRSFLDGYKAFCMKLTDLLRDVLQGCDGSTMSDPDPLIQRLTEIILSVSRIYDSLVSLATPLTTDKIQVQTPSFATALRTGTQVSKMNAEEDRGDKGAVAVQNSFGNLSMQDNANHQEELSGVGEGAKSVTKLKSNRLSEVQNASIRAASPKKKAQDPRTGKAIQERNCFAVSVWRRVKAKLDGRDVDFSRRMQISEQVDYVISEAMSHDNLALLYEGWTAWV